MGDGKKSKSPEEVRVVLASDEFKKWCVTSLEKWRHENPEEAAAINRTRSQVAEAFRRIGEHLAPVVEASRRIFEPLAPLAEVVLADEHANEHKRRFQAEGIAVPFDAAVRLAFCLMVLELPYRPAQQGEERPADTLFDIYDYEILAANSQFDKSIPELVEASESNPVAWEALQAEVKSLRQKGQPADALLEWALDAADGTRMRPTGKRQNTYVRNLVIVKTVRDLVACGLLARRNDGRSSKVRLRRSVACVKSAWCADGVFRRRSGLAAPAWGKLTDNLPHGIFRTRPYTPATVQIRP